MKYLLTLTLSVFLLTGCTRKVAFQTGYDTIEVEGHCIVKHVKHKESGIIGAKEVEDETVEIYPGPTDFPASGSGLLAILGILAQIAMNLL